MLMTYSRMILGGMLNNEGNTGYVASKGVKMLLFWPQQA